MVYMQEIGVTRVPQIIINILCFVALGAALVVLHECDASAIYKEGFFCDDQSIAYPDKDSTITSVHLVVGSFAFSFLAIIMCEMIAFFELWRRRRVDHKDGEKNSADVEGQKKEQDDDGSRPVIPEYPEPWKVLMTRILMQMVLLTYGFMLIAFVTEVIKVNTGRLRPNFLSVCQLVPGSYNCSVGFVTSYTCGQTDESKTVDSRKSFLSGHASMSFYHMVFIIFYVQPRLPLRYWSLLKPLVQTLAFLLATYVSITRITDYKHHYSDVAFGALLGTVTGIITAIKIGHVVPFRARPFPKSMFHRYYSYWHRDSDSTTLDRHESDHRGPSERPPYQQHNGPLSMIKI